MSIRAWLAGAAISASSVTCAAAPVMWFADSARELGTVDLASGQTTIIGTMDVMLTDIAFSPTGELFGVDFDALYRIDPTTAVATRIGPYDSRDDVNSLVFRSDGTLYGAGGALWTLSTTTGAATFVGLLTASSSGDLAFINGDLYLSVFDQPGNDALVRLNQSTGAESFIGATGRNAVYGLASPNGTDLFGAAYSSVFRIDTSTGAAGPDIAAAAIGDSVINGAAFFDEARPPVPEPSTAVLAALGLFALLLSWRRQWLVT